MQRRLNKPWKTVERQLQSLHMLELLDAEKRPYQQTKERWHYTLAAHVEPRAIQTDALATLEVPPETSLDTPMPQERETAEDVHKETPHVFSDKTGDSSKTSRNGRAQAVDDLFIWPASLSCQLCGRQLWEDGSCSNCVRSTP